MLNTNDLNLEEEILPLFDFTFNLYSGQAVKDILLRPPGSKEEILFRQQVLKGFVSNRNILKEYSFSRFNLSEVYDFLETFGAGSFVTGSVRRKLIFSEKERHQKRGKLILLILLFNKIQGSYLSKLDLSVFPAAYKTELEKLNSYFLDFHAAHYETVFRKKKIRVPHIVELLRVVFQKATNGETAAFWNRWFLFEAYVSISNGIIKHNFCFPVFDDTQFSLEEVYHPLLKAPVANTVTAAKNVILLTGPNMSGKSTLLKAVSVSVYLAHTGLAVPAAKATMPYFTTISVAINLTDSIVSGYSHFMSEIMTLKSVLLEAETGTKCFAVFDELFRGTNIEDALEISSATISGLVKFPESLFLISTHLHQLRDLEVIKKNAVTTWYIECALNNNIPYFTYKLKEGWSDLKLGRILFEKEGLNRLLE